jgi:limonene 1,2-monooxygenase
MRYLEHLGGGLPPYANSTDATLEEWSTKGIVAFGRITIGTPDDAIAMIEEFRRQSGGFGAFLLLAHNCADPVATRKSYELIARYVMPAVNRMNRNRGASLDWAKANSGKFIGAMFQGIGGAIQQYEDERKKRGGAGTAWVDAK